ncbi:Holliday junction branch migration protein RuvA [Tissierella creatinini]|nr:Holliday junction branch migration protein RuvA [Tissierella creatinini]TJX69246.1 Holliday junction branch migration protein RuvA [Soehngenia saccharolytica]
MFEFIIGKILSIKNEYVVIQNNGIGYKVFTSANTMKKLEIGKDNQILYTQLNVREDGIALFGFFSEEEMEMFHLLQLVSKVGPKVAVGILSTFTPNQIKIAILNRNIEELCKCPGIGRKTAERIIVELMDRVEKMDIGDEDIEIKGNFDNIYMESVEALMSLGYNRYEVEGILRLIDINSMTIEEVIKEGLKRLSKH